MDEGVCAIRPGTDVGRHARLLARTHDALFAGSRPPMDPRRLVLRGWQRARASGLNPDDHDPPSLLSPEQVEQRRYASPLHQVLPELRAALTAVAEDARHIMVVADVNGVLLWREGARAVRRRADGLGFTEGADWSEEAVGSNAIGTALAEANPVQMFAAEHFLRSHHGWTCTAWPVHDPRTGELLGVVDVSGPAETVHPTTVALVGTAVKVAELALWREHEYRLEALRAVAAPLLSRLSGPGLVVDDRGWVAAVSGMPGLERVAAPRGDRPLAVHGVGVCVPEPVPGGWLLRPSAARAIRLTLDLDSTPARAVVDGSSRWIHPLSTRHVEVLVLLARAGAAGLDGAALSEALYGDRAHLVTVRAEMSRLRRSLGGLLQARPYRIADEIEVRLPEHIHVAGSTAPGLRGICNPAATVADTASRE